MLRGQFEALRAQGFFRATPLPRDASGAAVRYAQGGARVIAAVAGPVQGRPAEARLGVFVAVQGRGWGSPGTQRHAEAVLRGVLERAVAGEEYPESELIVRVVVLEAAGDVLAAAVNAALLAVSAAGLRMHSTFFCFSFALAEGRAALAAASPTGPAVVADLFADRVLWVEGRGCPAQVLLGLLEEVAALRPCAADLLRSFFSECATERLEAAG